MTAVQFLTLEDILVMQAQVIDRFGGLHGLRDQGGLESALAAAENRSHYEGADLPALAATYAYHLCQAHAFLDGNKRIAALAMRVFLLINGSDLTATEDEKYELFIGLASDSLGRDEAEAFVRSHITSKDQE